MAVSHSDTTAHSPILCPVKILTTVLRADLGFKIFKLWRTSALLFDIEQSYSLKSSAMLMQDRSINTNEDERLKTARLIALSFAKTLRGPEFNSLQDFLSLAF